MARKSVSDCKSEEIKRLVGIGLSKRQVARAMKVHRRTVDRHLDEALDINTEDRPSSPEWTLNLFWQDLVAEVTRGVPAKVIWEELNETGKVPVTYQNFLIQLRKHLPPSAYFGPSRSPISDDAGQVFRLMPVTCFGHPGHPFRAIWSGFSVIPGINSGFITVT